MIVQGASLFRNNIQADKAARIFRTRETKPGFGKNIEKGTKLYDFFRPFLLGEARADVNF